MAKIKPPSANQAAAKLPSPCISVCQMDPSDRVCVGCYRTRGEIASWRDMDEADQRKLLYILSKRRAAATGVDRGGHVGKFKNWFVIAAQWHWCQLASWHNQTTASSI